MQAVRTEAEYEQMLVQETRFFTLSIDMLCITSFDGYFQHLNPAFERILGYRKEELLAKAFIDFVHPDDQAVTLTKIKEFSISEPSVEFEHRYRCKDGAYKWLKWQAHPVLAENLVYAIARDITEQKQSEELLAERARKAALDADISAAFSKYNNLQIVLQQCAEILVSHFNVASARIWTLDENEKILRLQASASIYTDINQHTQSCVPLGHLAIGRIAQERQPYLTNLFSNELISSEESGLSEGIVAFAGFPLVVEERLVGAIALFSCHQLPKRVLTDLTSAADAIATHIERKQTEQKIHQQAALLDIATNAILVRGLDHQILYWNKGAERLYGWTVAEVLGKNACQILFDEFSVQLQEAKKTVLEQGEWHGEFQQVTKNGNKVFVESHWTLVRNTDGKPISILAVNTNITEKKQIENKFLRTQRMESLGTLAGGIAHDLNNILTPILMSVQLLASKAADEQSQRLLATLETNTQRGSSLVKQLLSFARGIEPERTVIQIENIVTDIEQIVKEAFPKSIEFKVDIAKDIWTLPGDATQVHQLLMNLCVNARDAIPEGGILSISVKNIWLDQNYVQMNSEAKVGPYVEMTITDSGVGIPSAVIDKIFEPFFTTKELGKGTGLGLSTVMGIVKNHAGFVSVSSNIGKGTQFRVYLPAMNFEEIQQQEELELQLRRGQGELILVVDDEAAIVDVTKISLETSGYQVVTANDGIDAISTFVQNKQKISVALIDMMLPSMDGLITSKTLKRINPNIKIIATSGINKGNNNLAIKYGINRFLLKPFTSKELLIAISSVIENNHNT